MGDEETDALADVITAALDPAGVVDGAAAAESPAPSPEPVAAASVPEAAPSADPASTTGSAPEQPTTQSPDIKGHAADTTGDTASAAGSTSPSTATSRPAVAAQSAPSNLNVSVRIDSPGDNGAVTQVNIAAAAAIGVSNGAAPVVRDARIGAGIGTQLTVHRRESPRNGDIVAGFRDELGRRSRNRYVGVAMGLPVRSAVRGDITE